MMKVTLGGDRLGSGNKNKIALHNYERSTHNLSKKWTSSMTVGALYPFMVIPAMRGDKFDIDLAAAARTIPTQGPLFGSFKMQLDVFQCPVRLYQSILHNNPVDIGLKMSQVKFPKIHCITNVDAQTRYEHLEFNSSCLMKYLGVSGIGRYIPTEGQTGVKQAYRDFNALPLLAYYDIFKNYYSNKQEENAYCISGTELKIKAKERSVKLLYGENGTLHNINDPAQNTQYFCDNLWTDGRKGIGISIVFNNDIELNSFLNDFSIGITAGHNQTAIYNTYWKTLQEILDDTINETIDFTRWEITIGNGIENKQHSEWTGNEKSKTWTFYVTADNFASAYLDYVSELGTDEVYPDGFILYEGETYNATEAHFITLKSFNLKNIDKMREKLLSFHSMGNNFLITAETTDTNGIWGTNSGEDQSGLPYIINGQRYTNNKLGMQNEQPLNGLMVKTYQSDLFNNWIDTEWIEGDNGIAAITAIDTSSGEFNIDTLNLSEKLYNMLNRIAVSGGTYEDWQDAVYMQSPRRHLESPVYLGGMSNEVVFEEIVQTAPGGEAGLGSLGGRGILVKRKGGHINVKVDEASFIIGIVSLTPRLNYSQGNKWYMTELDSMDDLHKPALDGIGFQNLMEEQLAWFGTGVSGSNITRGTVGKVPAWINYMTDIDECYGDFAKDKGKSFMVLNRNYEHTSTSGISDLTTYIDPTKFNYAFAYTELAAQNFWVQIKCDIKARRLMSAKQIPNI